MATSLVSDSDVLKDQHLDPMISFIDQEAYEKVEEIETRADEEFVMEKHRLVKENVEKTNEFYQRKLKQVDIQKKIQASNSLNLARLECLRAREQHLQGVLQEAEKDLELISLDDQKYQVILKGLIMQALFQLLEKEVSIVCRHKDVGLVRKLIPECLEEIEKASGIKTHALIEEKKFLPSESAGGVEAFSRGGKIKVLSTLESRLCLIAEQIVPQMRTALFGINPSRRFFD